MSEIMCPRPNCGEGPFNHIGTHWSSDRCEYPPLTQRQHEICVGLLMGDGGVGKMQSKNQRIQVNMITKEYLEYLDVVFGVLSTGVHLKMTAEEKARENRESGFRPEAREENYSDVYRWRTRSHPRITELTSWYDSGTKVWPKEIDLTPTVLKHWYCGDGHFENGGRARYISVSLANEAEHEEKVASYFDTIEPPRPNRWETSVRDDGSHRCRAVWNVNESEELWEYMLSDGYGIPPGFEYKWPSEYHDHTETMADTTVSEAVA